MCLMKIELSKITYSFQILFKLGLKLLLVCFFFCQFPYERFPFHLRFFRQITSTKYIICSILTIIDFQFNLPGLDHGVVDVHGGRQQLARLGHLVETMHAGDALFNNAFEAVNFEDGIVFLNKKVGGITPVIEDHVGLPTIARKLQEN